jgi:hypothetical protein
MISRTTAQITIQTQPTIVVRPLDRSWVFSGTSMLQLNLSGSFSSKHLKKETKK